MDVTVTVLCVKWRNKKTTIKIIKNNIKVMA